MFNTPDSPAKTPVGYTTQGGNYWTLITPEIWKVLHAVLHINALLMAVYRRRPEQDVLVHSDQGSQFSSYDWQDFLRAHKLKPSMSRRGNCHDNALAESFSQLLKRERIRQKTYLSREDARQDVFNYIEMFYNPKRRHSVSGGLSPVEYEKQYFQRFSSV
jgi:putative transposase